MPFRFWSILFCLCVLTLSARSQGVLDSILTHLEHPAKDSAAVLKIYDYAYEIEQEKPNEALRLYKEGVALGKEIGFSFAAGKGTSYQGMVHFTLGEMDKALEKYWEAFGLVDTTKEIRFVAVLYNNIGNVHNIKGEFAKAIDYLQKANAKFEEAKDTVSFIINKTNIGALLNRSGNYEEAIRTLKENLETTLPLNDPSLLSDIYDNLGTTYNELKDYKTSLGYYKQSYANYKLAKREIVFITLSLANLSRQFFLLGEIDSTEKYILEARKLADTYNIPREYSNVYSLYSLFLAEKGELKAAENAARLSLENIRQIGDPNLEKGALEALIFALEKQNDLSRAAPHYQRYISLQDSLGNLEKNRQLLTLRTQFQTAQKEKEIAQLTKEKALNDLQLQQQRSLSIGLVVGIFIIALVAFFVVRNYRQGKRISDQEKIIQEQKVKELEERQKILAFNAMMKGQEEERIRIAKDLHDGLGGALAAVKMRLEAFPSQKQPHAFISTTTEMVDQAYGEVRRIAHNMSPYTLNKFGLVKAIQNLCDHVQDTGRIDIEFQALRIGKDIPALVEVMVYRIIQELINNILKHAEANQVIVQISQSNNNLHITVEDDGKGFDVEEVSDGMGMKSIRSRVESLEGDFSIESQKSEGTSIFIILPL